MKKIIENLYDKTEHLLSESVVGEVARLLGLSPDDVEKAVDALDFADYLELGNAVNLEDKELASEILGMGSVDEYTAFDADDEDEDDTGINFVDQLEGDYDEEDDLFDDDYDGLEEADNAYGGGGDNSFSAPKGQQQQQQPEEEEEDMVDPEAEESFAKLLPQATKAAREKNQARSSASLTPAEKAANLKKIADLKTGDDVYVLGVDGKPKKATYKGSVNASGEKFLANIRSKEGQGQQRDRRVSYSNIMSPEELTQESAGSGLPKGWPKPKDPWTPDTPVPEKFYRNGKLVKDQKYKDWVASQKKNPMEESMEYEGASAQSVANAIWHRIKVRHLDLLDKYGIDALNSAVQEISEFHAGAEELGSSDVSIMVNQVQDQLARENPKAGCTACEGGGLDEWGDICVTCGSYDTLDMNEDRMRKLAGLAEKPVKETASGGATGAGAIASSPVAVGGMQKRNPSIYAGTKPEPKSRKKDKKGDGVGRDKKA